jgi:hypothetical protein
MEGLNVLAHAVDHEDRDVFRSARVSGRFVIRAAGSWIVAACVVIAISGCTKSTETYAEVTGTVTIDGVPAANVLVTFEPQSENPRKMRPSSFGPTNENGEFRMMRRATQSGVVTGLHHVRITPIEREGGKNTVVHPRYQANNALWSDVAPGDNLINFELREDPTAPAK